MEQKYFNFNEGIEIVYGPIRSAIYDLNSGDVFSIDEDGSSILRDLESCVVIKDLQILKSIDKDSVREFLQELQDNNIGSFSNKAKKRQRKNSINSYPLILDVLWLELTNQCNLKCIHCYAECVCKKDGIEEIMLLEDWKRVISEASTLFCKRLTFIGGEPFLKSKMLLILVKYAKELDGIGEIEIFTNGTIFNEDLLNDLILTGSTFAFSVYSSDSEIHDKITGVKGSFEKTMKMINYLKTRNVPFRIAIIAMRENENDIENTVDWLESLYPEADIGYDVVRPFGRGSSEEILPKRQFPGYVRYEPDFPKISEDSFWKRHYGHSCLCGRLVISSNGIVRPCIMSDDHLGNVCERSLKEILLSKNVSDVWGFTKSNISECADCEFRYACIDCLPRTIHIAGNRYSKPPECLYNPKTGKWDNTPIQRRKK